MWDAKMVGRPARAALTVLAVALLIAVGTAWAGYGNLEIQSDRDGDLILTHSEGWTLTARLQAPATTLWDIPSGAYTLDFQPDRAASDPRQPAPLQGECWVPDQMTLALVGVADGGFRIRENQTGAHGALTHLDAEMWWALPGSKSEILASLDTRVRVRPSASVDGLAAGVATERRLLVPGQRGAVGELLLTQSPLSPEGGAPPVRWSLAHPTQGHLPPSPADGPSQPAYPQRPLRLAVGATQNTREGTHLEGQIAMARWPFFGLPGRGHVGMRYSNLNDASPRPEGGNVLPHNDATVLDLVGRLELGSPAHLALWGVDGNEPRTAQPISAGRYGLSLQVAARGWQRNHFLQEYLHNLEHAPHEETALFDSRVGLSMKTGRSSSGTIWFGYNRYVTWLGDGVHEQELAGYVRPGGEPNGGADPTGLYWQGYDPESLTGAHVFDYYLRKYSTTLSLGLDARQARGTRAQWGVKGSVDQYSYRRYEHFSPLSDHAIYDENGNSPSLRIGYDKLGDTIDDGPHGPGQATAGRLTLWDKRPVGAAWQVQLGVGAHYFSCAESALVTFENPRGDNGRLDANELRKTEAVVNPEASLALRGAMSPGTQAWVLARRQVHQPPLEALFSPQAHLLTTTMEGVVGNPDLEPEKETSLEIGLGRQSTIGGRPWRWQAALYGTRISEAISLGQIRLSAQVDPDATMPVYINDGELQQMGLHLEAVSAVPGHPLWMRVAYDFSRTQTDYFEPPLLDQRWLDPDRPTGEYASEGYPGAAGGILDLILAPAAGNGLTSREQRPSNYDRPHQFSLALIHRGSPPARGAAWLQQLAAGWDTGLLVRVESGRRYTQTYAYPAGLLPPADAAARGPDDATWAQVVQDALRNDAAAGARLTIDLALTRRVPLGERSLRFSIEALNIPGIKNALSVYRATGDPDDDGCSSSAGCGDQLPSEVDLETYLKRILDPRHYDRPFVLRAGVSVDIL